MGMYNILKLSPSCPVCEVKSDMEAEFRFGFLNLDRYQIGDKLRWNDNGGGLRNPKQRPENGDYTGETYVECPNCHYDFWLIVEVRQDIIQSAVIDQNRAGYITQAGRQVSSG